MPAPPFVNRAALFRKDTARLAAMCADAGTRFLVLAGGKAVIQSDTARTITNIHWFELAELAEAAEAVPDDAIFLGIEHETGAGRFALPVPETIAERHPELFKPAVDFRSLVTQGTMPDADLAAIATALSLEHWHLRTRFCGTCGGPTSSTDSGWKRICPSCTAEQFPRVDPVVIMLVTDGVRAVLAREPHFPPGLYSTLAGFVEPGEGIEGAVIRETAEEVGLAVYRVACVADQPWPMPHALMLGCIAHVAPGAALTIDRTEIEDARWFTRGEVIELIDGKAPNGLHVPPRQAIANMLMRTWAGLLPEKPATLHSSP